MMNLPPDDDRGTYTNRAHELVTLTEVWRSKDHDPNHVDGDERVAISTSENWGANIQYVTELNVGDELIIETVRGSSIVGYARDGEWLWRQTDEEVEQAHKEYSAAFHDKNLARFEEHGDQWLKEVAELPDWIKRRINTFTARGGRNFELNGLAYELVVAKLAVAYANMGESIMSEDIFSLKDSDEVEEISKSEGTSGNQHEVALALAKAHLSGIDLAETASALTPLTGDPFYEREE